MSIISYTNEMFQMARVGESQGIFFIIAVFFLINFILLLLLQKAICRWPWTEGELVNVAIKKQNRLKYFEPIPDFDSDTDSKTLYSYRVGNKTYSGSRTSIWAFFSAMNAPMLLSMKPEALEWVSETQFRVYYKPGKPEKSYLIKPGIKSQYITGMAAFLPMAFYSLKYL